MAKGKKTGGRKIGSLNKATADVKALAQQYTPDAIKTLSSIMNDKEAPPAARIQAASALLDRGYGKPSQHIEAIVHDRPDVALDEVARMMLFAMRDSEERGITLEDNSVLDIQAVSNRH